MEYSSRELDRVEPIDTRKYFFAPHLFDELSDHWGQDPGLEAFCLNLEEWALTVEETPLNYLLGAIRESSDGVFRLVIEHDNPQKWELLTRYEVEVSFDTPEESELIIVVRAFEVTPELQADYFCNRLNEARPTSSQISPIGFVRDGGRFIDGIAPLSTRLVYESASRVLRERIDGILAKLISQGFTFGRVDIRIGARFSMKPFRLKAPPSVPFLSIGFYVDPDHHRNLVTYHTPVFGLNGPKNFSRIQPDQVVENRSGGLDTSRVVFWVVGHEMPGYGPLLFVFQEGTCFSEE